MASIICYVCSANVPREFAHIHHERPQAVGGTDNDTIFLCSGCHANIHQISNMLRTSKAGRAEDVIRSYTVYSKSLQAQRRCMEVALEVTRWFQMRDAGQIKIGPDDEVEFVVKLPLRIKRALQAEASTVKDPKSGRKVGMARLASGIISDWVVRKYPALRQGSSTKS